MAGATTSGEHGVSNFKGHRETFVLSLFAIGVTRDRKSFNLSLP